MKNDVFAKPGSSITCGEVLSDGRVIDLVAPTADEPLKLVVFNGERPLILSEAEHKQVRYVPPDLDRMTRNAIRFPAGVAEYGTIVTLLSKVMQLFNRCWGLSDECGMIVALWVLSGWVPERFLAPPILCISCVSRELVMALFRFFRALCRRAIAITRLSEELLFVRPTLLVVDAELSEKALASWRDSNYQNVYVPKAGGSLRQLSSSKALSSATGDFGWWGEEALNIVLLPDAMIPAEADLEAIAAEFQPQFELCRLRHLQARAQPVTCQWPAELSVSTLGRQFFRLLADEPGSEALLLPLLEQQRQTTAARRTLDPLAVIIEVIWMPSHQSELIPVSEVRDRVNALLRNRGEQLEYKVTEIGWKLRDLELPRQRRAKRMVLRFSRELRKRIHGLAGQFGLTLTPVDGCPDCAAPVQVVEH